MTLLEEFCILISVLTLPSYSFPWIISGSGFLRAVGVSRIVEYLCVCSRFALLFNASHVALEIGLFKSEVLSISLITLFTSEIVGVLNSSPIIFAIIIKY